MIRRRSLIGLNAAPLPTDGLLAYYPFNGNANDESGNGYHGTIYGATLATDRHGNANSCYYFNGSSYIEIGDVLDLGLENRTISLWVNADGLGSVRGVLSKSILAGAVGRWAIYFDGINITSLVQITSGGKTAFFGTNALIWHHILATIDRNGSMSIYVDGILRNSIDISAGVSDNLQTTYKLRIGCYNDASGNPGVYFAGYIDDIRIYNRVLTTDEITALYNE